MVDLTRKLKRAAQLLRDPEERRVYFGQRQAVRRPLDSAWIEVSAVCNLDCITCPRQEGITPEPLKLMPMETYHKVADAIFPYIRNVNFIGLGESLMHPQIDQIISHAKSKFVGVNMTSNGTIMTDKIAHKLIDSGLDSIAFSIDGGTKETFESIRVNARFDKVQRNIRRLIEAKKALNVQRPWIAMGMVLMKTNVRELSDVVRLCHELEIPTLNAENVFTWNEEMERTLPLYNGINPEEKEAIEKAKQTAAELGINLELPGFILKEPGPCSYRPHEHFVVTWEGNLRPCCNLFHPYEYVFQGQKKFAHEATMGNLLEEDFLSIWNKPDYTAFRKANETGIGLPEVCRDCLFSRGL
ncbi:MAG: radical SAM protein [candidate division Zixibacteria bacterium]|nr:radical SAM protein [candidate division Zixibacteria bacterium]